MTDALSLLAQKEVILETIRDKIENKTYLLRVGSLRRRRSTKGVQKFYSDYKISQDFARLTSLEKNAGNPLIEFAISNLRK